MTIHSFSAEGTTKEEPPLLSNYLTGQLPAIELPLNLPPRLVTMVFAGTSEILKEYFGGDRPSTPLQDTSDPRVFTRTNSSAVSSTHSMQTSDSVDVSNSQSRDQIRKELNQNYDFLKTLRNAQDGSANAQFNFGKMYEEGRSVKQDYAEALNWYRKAADQGHASAQCILGWMCQHSFGVKQDDVQAVHWYRLAAEQGLASAQYNLGWMCQRGLGVKQDDAQAVVWYRKAAEQGQASAQYNLGWMYDRGLGVKRDYNQALIWFRMVAEQGDADAQFQIGTMYATGKGVEVNDVEAFNWYFKAAKNGSAYAQLELTSVYHQGLGVKKDVLQATYWFLKSIGEDLNREIVLSDDGITMDCYSDVIQCIPDALTTFPEFKYIKTINFQNIVLSAKNFLSIGEMIRANTHLEGLNFEFQEIDDAQALTLSQSLAFNTTLTELVFDDEYGFDASIFDEIKASLAQNVVIAELREHMKNHPITRSDELPLEVLDIIVDDMIVAASKSGKSKEATIAAIDEFLLSVSQQKLNDDLKKSS